MQDAVSEWLAAARHRFLVGYPRSVIDSAGPAGVEFARIADFARSAIMLGGASYCTQNDQFWRCLTFSLGSLWRCAAATCRLGRVYCPADRGCPQWLLRSGT